ncbi:hypothetical protein C8J56DRAFT_979462 [Mycena floridula]|nr:hypothetical protein C8J56DRAFT_979462 [Mycena floridula]
MLFQFTVLSLVACMISSALAAPVDLLIRHKSDKAAKAALVGNGSNRGKVAAAASATLSAAISPTAKAAVTKVAAAATVTATVTVTVTKDTVKATSKAAAAAKTSQASAAKATQASKAKGPSASQVNANDIAAEIMAAKKNATAKSGNQKSSKTVSSDTVVISLSSGSGTQVAESVATATLSVEVANALFGNFFTIPRDLTAVSVAK